MIIALSLFVCLLGLLLYVIAKQPDEKQREIGFAMFCCGLLAWLLQAGPWFSSFHVFTRG